jgi:hypothetical protein
MKQLAKAQEFVEKQTGQVVTLHKQSCGWYAFKNSTGNIAVVYWDVFNQTFAIPSLVPASKKYQLDIS